MSTEFNPATLKYRNAVFDAEKAPYPGDCKGCHFEQLPFQRWSCSSCSTLDRADGQDIIWVIRAQEGKKA